MSFDCTKDPYKNEAENLSLELIESEELKSRLKVHIQFLEQQEYKTPLIPRFLFEDQFNMIRSRKIEINKQAVGNSVLSLIVEAFNQLHFSREEIDQQISEISEYDFLKSIDLFYWDFNDRLLEGQSLSPETYAAHTLMLLASFYFSYVLTLLSANEMLQIVLEMNHRTENGEVMTFEKFLNAAEVLSDDFHKDHPIEWVLQLV